MKSTKERILSTEQEKREKWTQQKTKAIKVRHDRKLRTVNSWTTCTAIYCRITVNKTVVAAACLGSRKLRTVDWRPKWKIWVPSIEMKSVIWKHNTGKPWRKPRRNLWTSYGPKKTNLRRSLSRRKKQLARGRGRESIRGEILRIFIIYVTFPFFNRINFIIESVIRDFTSAHLIDTFGALLLPSNLEVQFIWKNWIARNLLTSLEDEVFQIS